MALRRHCQGISKLSQVTLTPYDQLNKKAPDKNLQVFSWVNRPANSYDQSNVQDCFKSKLSTACKVRGSSSLLQESIF
jgi:hypothetical protein